jgi:hypothetical protein
MRHLTARMYISPPLSFVRRRMRSPCCVVSNESRRSFLPRTSCFTFCHTISSTFMKVAHLYITRKTIFPLVNCSLQHNSLIFCSLFLLTLFRHRQLQFIHYLQQQASLLCYLITSWCSGLLGFWTLSIVQFSKEHNVSGTGPVSVLRWGAGRHLLCLVRLRELASVTGPAECNLRNFVLSKKTGR